MQGGAGLGLAVNVNAGLEQQSGRVAGGAGRALRAMSFTQEPLKAEVESILFSLEEGLSILN